MGKRTGIMLAYPLSTTHLERMSTVYYQPKIDGLRCRAELNNGTVKLFSSQGNEIQSHPWLVEELTTKFPHDTVTLDGELHTFKLSFEDLCSAMKRHMPVHSGQLVKFKVFDFIGLGTFENRIQYLERLFLERTSGLSKWLRLVSTYAGTPAQLAHYLDQFMQARYEGIMVRDPRSLYETKRSWGLMKYKPQRHDVYTIIGVMEEIAIDGTPKAALGSFVCESESGEQFTVGSGPLLTRDQRMSLWLNQQTIIGRRILVKYQELTKDRQVPRFPVVMSFVN